MQISERNFASTQPINPLPGQAIETTVVSQSATTQRVQHLLYSLPMSPLSLVLRMLHLRAAVALLVPVIAGAMLGWWQTGHGTSAILVLLLSSALTLILGINLLNDNRDYLYAQKSNDVKFTPDCFATTYHLLATGQLQSSQVSLIGYSLLLYSVLSQLGLVLFVGWPVLFFYLLSLLLLYTYATPPVRYGYRGWGLGEIGVFLGYGILPVIGSYFIVGQTLSWLPVWVSLPFGLFAILIFFNYNLVHYRRDWLMRKRTLVVSLGPLRTFDLSALLTVIIYASLVTIVSLAHLPLSTLVTLAALPLALGGFSRLRNEQPHLDEVFWLHLTTLNATIWTGLLFCTALLVDKLFS